MKEFVYYTIFELFFSSYVNGLSVCIFVALGVQMSVAGANKQVQIYYKY